MSRLSACHRAALAVALGLCAFAASAQDVLIRGARVHTAGAAGTLENTDVLVQGGVIRAIGPGLAAPAGVVVHEANGRPLTPGLFGGITGIGLEEVSGESATVDHALSLGGELPPQQVQMRPEFDVSPAYNPRSTLVPVARQEGLTWTLLGASSVPGGTIIGGLGGPVRLDGGWEAPYAGTRVLFIALGAGHAPLAGNTRAAEYMLLGQALAEARAPAASGAQPLLTAAGRATLARHLGANAAPTVIQAERAADLRQVLRISREAGLRPVIAGASEGWVVAADLAAADATVFIDALVNLPGSFDQIGARLDNAALLHAAGVPVAFSQAGDASHNARKVRQLAGNAVAHGLPWEAGLAGLTSVPADALGLGDRLGRIEVGKVADLVLWTGDPLELTSVPSAVWMDGRATSLRSRQTELRDRYLRPAGAMPRAYPAR